ncbi:Ribosomal RNA small subunit methyltransferase G, partial [Dissostichus eleginoides]
MFQTEGGPGLNLRLHQQAAAARALGLEPQSSRHASLPGKNERSLRTIKTGQQFDVCLY